MTNCCGAAPNGAPRIATAAARALKRGAATAAPVTTAPFLWIGRSRQRPTKEGEGRRKLASLPPPFLSFFLRSFFCETYKANVITGRRVERGGVVVGHVARRAARGRGVVVAAQPMAVVVMVVSVAAHECDVISCGVVFETNLVDVLVVEIGSVAIVVRVECSVQYLLIAGTGPEHGAQASAKKQHKRFRLLCVCECVCHNIFLGFFV